MLTEKQAKELAKHWVEAWNSHDLEKILSHYDANVVLTSPVAAKILGESFGVVKGKKALKAYFAKGLQAYPGLKFELIDVLWGINSVVLYYKNQIGSSAAEYMELNTDGKISRVGANYNA